MLLQAALLQSLQGDRVTNEIIWYVPFEHIFGMEAPWLMESCSDGKLFCMMENGPPSSRNKDEHDSDIMCSLIIVHSAPIVQDKADDVVGRGYQGSWCLCEFSRCEPESDGQLDQLQVGGGERGRLVAVQTPLCQHFAKTRLDLATGHLCFPNPCRSKGVVTHQVEAHRADGHV